MCQLIETIQVKNGVLQDINYHKQRFRKTRMKIFGCKPDIDLSDFVLLTPELKNGLYKCRVTYDSQIRNVEFESYKPKTIASLKIVHCNTIDYKYKYKNRSDINELYKRRKKCDDVLIVKNGYITDTSFCNVLFFDGKDWYTPSTPLLEGTKRQKLLEKNIIKEKGIKVSDLRQFRSAMLINAMLDFDLCRTIAIANVYE